MVCAHALLLRSDFLYLLVSLTGCNPPGDGRKLWATHEASHSGGGIPGAYSNVSSANRNFDSEGNIAATYPYACSWHDRVRAAAVSGMYNASAQPGVPGDQNSIVVAGQPTPDGSPL